MLSYIRKNRLIPVKFCVVIEVTDLCTLILVYMMTFIQGHLFEKAKSSVQILFSDMLR